MKRRILMGLGITVVVLLVLASPFIAAFAGNAPPIDGTELPGGARLVADSFALLYVVPLGEKEVALVDCGMDKDAKAIRAELKRRNLDDSAVTHIFLTHGHPDHTAGCAQFPKAQLAVMKEEAPLLEGKPVHPSPMSHIGGDKPTGLTISMPLTDGQQVTIGETTITAFAVPGHTDGSTAYLINGVLYVGDSAGATTTGAIKAAPWIFSANGEQNRQQLKVLAGKVASLGVKQIAFGHTAPTEAKALAEFVP